MNNTIIKMKCSDCGGQLTKDDGQSYIYCPYCGSKSLIIESDEVQIERIRSEHEIEKIKLNNKIKRDNEKQDRITILKTLAGLVIALIIIVILSMVI